MPYLISFKNKYTKGRWIKQNLPHPTKAGANRTAKYIMSQRDEDGSPLPTKVKIEKVK